MHCAVSPIVADRLVRAQLADGVHAAKVGSDLVLLDLSTDSYLLVSDCGEVRVEGSTLHAPKDLLLDLAANALLQSDGTSESRSRPPPLATRRLPDVRVGDPSLTDMMTFARLWGDTARRRPTIQSLVRRSSGRRGRRDDLQAIAARVGLFRRMLPSAPAVGACLFQAELLLRFLNAADLDADWVFGVRLWPFLAHCWLQVGDHCVSQSPDTLAIYRPILVI